MARSHHRKKHKQHLRLFRQKHETATEAARGKASVVFSIGGAFVGLAIAYFASGGAYFWMGLGLIAGAVAGYYLGKKVDVDKS